MGQDSYHKYTTTKHQVHTQNKDTYETKRKGTKVHIMSHHHVKTQGHVAMNKDKENGARMYTMSHRVVKQRILSSNKETDHVIRKHWSSFAV